MRTLSELGISPAPWKVDDELDDCVNDANGEQVMITTHGNLERAKRNACFISAETEIYEALRKLVEYLNLNEWDNQELAPLVDAAEYALNKACGTEAML